MRTFAIAFALAVGLGSFGATTDIAHAQDAKAGAKVFRLCRSCHKVGEKALKQRAVGPHLNGLFGRKSGSVEGYKYSKANKSSGITWSEEIFTDYIKNPRKFMKGTKMAFGGIKDEKKIKDLIAYLKQYKADGTKAN